MMKIKNILRLVQLARMQDDDCFRQDGQRVERVRMGMNNALYRVEDGEQVVAVKLCVNDERRRAQREYAALRLLWEAEADIAPQPLALDESKTILPYPVVVYRWLPGEPLGVGSAGQRFSRRKLAALLELVQRVHSIQTPGDEPEGKMALPEAIFHRFERRLYLDELHSFLECYQPWLCVAIENGQSLSARLERIVMSCEQALKASPARIDRESVPLRLCHVDPNPDNLISGSDGRLRWVDWEYSGWGDPALDLADICWHQGFSFASPEQIAWMRRRYQPPPEDEGFAQRLRLWDALLAARWPLLVLRWLWSLDNGPDRERLSLPQAHPAELQRRMAALIERAEGFFSIAI
jgi:aminoglycoside phosphotransferase (APT) family kinase protein